jgi:Phytanoyl-CoA dioxygenase (PhyH)
MEGQNMEQELLDELDREGIVRLPDLISAGQLRSMQQAFAVRLRRIRWNNTDGYEKTERYRHMVEDILTLDQGFLDVAIHPMVKALARGYLGDRFALVEAKGWKTLVTQDFHGWHADEWYDQTVADEIPRELKLGVYLTDVKSGPFTYTRRSHRRQHPRMIKRHEVRTLPEAMIVDVTGPAGTAFLFDTSGIHRQAVPVREERNAIFYCYHDPDVPLAQDNIDFYRYHPLLLNAAFLGGLTEEDCRILGFGSKKSFIPAFEPPPSYDYLHRAFRLVHEGVIRVDEVQERVATALRRRLPRLGGRS